MLTIALTFLILGLAAGALGLWTSAAVIAIKMGWILMVVGLILLAAHLISKLICKASGRPPA
jgi:hypothetical protein